MRLILSMFLLLAFSLSTNSFATQPTLLFKNQFGEQTNASIISGTFIGNTIAANSVLSNLTGSTAFPIANTYAAVSAKLTPAMLCTGFISGAGTVAGTDTVLQAIQKLSGNIQNRTVLVNVLTGFTAGAGTLSSTDTVLSGLQKLAGNVAAHQANSTAPDVAALVVDFNALLAKLQAANLMQ